MVYKEGADLDPADPTLLSNLSAAVYELGLYEQCIGITLKVLKLMKPEKKALRPKLTARKVKSYLYIKQAHKLSKLYLHCPQVIPSMHCAAQ